jgi:hypothetical protein
MKQGKIKKKTRTQFGNTKIWYVPIQHNQENIQETFQPTLNFKGLYSVMR